MCVCEKRDGVRGMFCEVRIVGLGSSMREDPGGCEVRSRGWSRLYCGEVRSIL